ncbi:uncharacterized protein LOC106657483 [Trichogramma pretiosum]|uniref:uncharacterized protein LOC106657483 n=1 Tax=Trichogramma pretiosum TaxID=7493 RepID=UPI0006C9A90A|nr:uncharacterized protein LOC106657483 [Trichogramma pretiosum]XP_014234508.1 uncharacterized protein LOC106657483 [Trichogramma pretiosum]XP_014234509.1 uncharacterized protein LOC106657483 [Trichogramma pretiosum]
MAEVDQHNSHIIRNFPMSFKLPFTSCLTPQDVNIKDLEGNSPLHFAVVSTDKSIVEILLNAGAVINDARLDGFTPLHMAVQSGKENNVKLLLDCGARVDSKDLFGKTPLHLAACVNYRDERKMLRIAKLLLDTGPDSKALLNECTDSGETALHYAIMNGSRELLTLFLQYGANVNAKNRDGKCPLFFAIEFENTKIAKLLLKHEATIVNSKTNHGITPLHEAITQRAEKNVQLLLDYGADVNAKDIYGNTPLHIAARLNYLDERTMDRIVKLLVDKGADVNDDTMAGETAFHFAIINGNEKLVRLFLKYGANVNKKNHDGKSSLHFAIQYSNKNIVKLLLDRGARIDDRTNDGKLSLHVAVAVEDENMIKVLLEYNADVNAIDRSGKTPLSLAFEVAYMRSIYNPWNGFCPIHTDIGCDDNIFELLIKHIAKMPKISEENLRMINNDEKLSVFFRNCLKELSRMKPNICDNISLFKVLTKSMDIIVGYTKNQDLLRLLHSNVFANEFPIYYSMLKERFHKAESRRRLIEPSLVVFSWLVRPYVLPDIVTSQIFSYLTSEDLVNLKMT